MVALLPYGGSSTGLGVRDRRSGFAVLRGSGLGFEVTRVHGSCFSIGLVWT